MPKSPSGRVVVELEPGLKRMLYSRLAIENLTLKEWLTEQINVYLQEAANSKEESK